MAQGGLAMRDAGGPMLDRSHLHVLLCDKDPKTAREVLSLLRRCSYQVTAVKTARQVIDVLNSNVSEVDLILTEVELPKEKGFKMIKHIMRQERLKRIPIVMMSARDEMAVVVKCLKLGAADYLVKPLRTNELLNLWTHMWRRRRLLGLTEKHIINGSLHTAFDLLISDTSESNNTNSTNLFSDDTDDKMRITSTEVANALASCDLESEMSPQLELSLKPSSDLSVELISQQCARAGFMYSPPQKSELKLGQSSAFLSYSKASKQLSERSANVQSSAKVSNHCREPTATMQSNVGTIQKKPMGFPQQQSVLGVSSQEVPPVDQMEGAHLSSRSEHGSGEVDSRDSVSVCWNNSSLPCEMTGGKFPPGDQFPVMHFSGHYESHGNVAGISPLSPPQFVNGGILHSTIHSSPGLLPPAIHLYHGLLQDETAGITAKMPPFHALPPGHGLHLNNTFPYYPLGLHMVSAQLGPFPSWPAIAATPLIDRKLTQAERREAALSKFRRKRKDRCFEKKIRYVSRKKLAEQRPRIRGQFVRRTGDMDMIDNVDEYDEDEEDDGQGYSELGPGSSPESMARDTGNGLQCTG